MPDAVVCWGGRDAGSAAEPEHADDAPKDGESGGGVERGVHRPTGASRTETSSDACAEAVSE